MENLTIQLLDSSIIYFEITFLSLCRKRKEKNMPPAFLDGWMDGCAMCVCVLFPFQESEFGEFGKTLNVYIHSKATTIFAMISFSHFCSSHSLGNKKKVYYQRFDILTFKTDNKIECNATQRHRNNSITFAADTYIRLKFANFSRFHVYLQNPIH